MEGDERLTDNLKNYLEFEKFDLYLSTVSFWEMAIKSSLNKLTLKFSLQDYYDNFINNSGKILNLNINHFSQIQTLPFPDTNHRDPFDRMLIAQAIVEDMPIITKDIKFSSYNIEIIW
jgi:PIN domain nuclease of toxin-antitoxin system